jgi:hypothetical protein
MLLNLLKSQTAAVADAADAAGAVALTTWGIQ